MPHLLHLDSSARRIGSASRTLSALFAHHWQVAHPEGVVTYRDLANDPLPHVDDALVKAMFVPLPYQTSEQLATTAFQERLIAEVEAAETLVIGAPMYNFTISSSLKAWIDHVVVFGRTVDKGLFNGRRVVVVTARGGTYGEGTPRAPFDYQEPYLRAILGMVGLTDIVFIHAEMRAAADGDPSLAHLSQFASDSLTAAQAVVIAEARRRRAVAAPTATLA
jgi:FMN-dependent NADH-azoreductase